jgi:hypothetical protein
MSIARTLRLHYLLLALFAPLCALPVNAWATYQAFSGKNISRQLAPDEVRKIIELPLEELLALQVYPDQLNHISVPPTAIAGNSDVGCTPDIIPANRLQLKQYT